MLKTKHLFIASCLTALCLPGFANDYKKPVIDREERPILDQQGDCIETKWDGNRSNCKAGFDYSLGLEREDRTVYFDYDRARLNKDAIEKLDALIATVKDSGKVVRAKVVGHADRTGNSSYNQVLSQRRAVAVRDYLKKEGGISTHVVDLDAQGESMPVTNGCPETKNQSKLIKCLARDRRVEVLIEVDR